MKGVFGHYSLRLLLVYPAYERDYLLSWSAEHSQRFGVRLTLFGADSLEQDETAYSMHGGLLAMLNCHIHGLADRR